MRKSITLHAAWGVLAALAGMAAAHLVAALTTPAASPVLAVGSQVIDATPTPVKEWAVRTFGTHDKAILIGSVLAVTLAAAGLIGVVARTRLRLAALLMVGLVALAGAAVLTRPVADPFDVVPSLVAAVVGPLVLAWAAKHVSRSAATTPGATTEATTGLGRRGVLLGAGAVAVLSGAALVGGQWIVRARSSLADIRLPRPRRPLDQLPAGVEAEHPGVSAFVTPNRSFYRVDTKLAVPIVDHESWTLTIDGDVDRKVELTYDDLRDLEVVERDITLTCVSNEVGGKLVGAARWTGVPLNSLLDLAGVGTRSDQLLSTDVEGFNISTPLSVATDGRDALVALGMNGTVLPRQHGFPARLVVPGLYGFVGATKWLSKLTLTTYDAHEAYWTKRDWATDAPIKPSSRIDTPRPLAKLKAGRTVIGGVAWAQHHGVRKVQVRIDGGGWQDAELGPDAGVDYWRQWYLPWDARPGSHTLAVRCIDGDGNVQSPARATPFPNGSSGIQDLVVTVV